MLLENGPHGIDRVFASIFFNSKKKKNQNTIRWHGFKWSRWPTLAANASANTYSLLDFVILFPKVARRTRTTLSSLSPIEIVARPYRTAFNILSLKVSRALSAETMLYRVQMRTAIFTITKSFRTTKKKKSLAKFGSRRKISSFFLLFFFYRMIIMLQSAATTRALEHDATNRRKKVNWRNRWQREKGKRCRQ